MPPKKKKKSDVKIVKAVKSQRPDVGPTMIRMAVTDEEKKLVLEHLGIKYESFVSKAVPHSSTSPGVKEMARNANIDFARKSNGTLVVTEHMNARHPRRLQIYDNGQRCHLFTVDGATFYMTITASEFIYRAGSMQLSTPEGENSTLVLWKDDGTIHRASVGYRAIKYASNEVYDTMTQKSFDSSRPLWTYGIEYPVVPVPSEPLTDVQGEDEVTNASAPVEGEPGDDVEDDDPGNTGSSETSTEPSAPSMEGEVDAVEVKMEDGNYVGSVDRRIRPHGRGTATYNDGSTYTGEFKNGRRHGRGHYSKPTGRAFEVEFTADKSLEDTMKARCVTYDGDWRNGKRNGHGVGVDKNGEEYCGYWKDDMRHGNGTCGEYSGMWRKDQRHGPGRLGTRTHYVQATWKNDKTYGGKLHVTPEMHCMVPGDPNAPRTVETRHYTYVGSVTCTFRPHGHGTYTDKETGTSITGSFDNGVLEFIHKPVKVRLPNGDVYNGKICYPYSLNMIDMCYYEGTMTYSKTSVKEHGCVSYSGSWCGTHTYFGQGTLVKMVGHVPTRIRGEFFDGEPIGKATVTPLLDEQGEQDKCTML